MEKGFTLLEVVIAIVMLAVSLTVILNIYTNYIKQYGEISREIEYIQKVKQYIFDIKEQDESMPVVQVKTQNQQFGVIKKIYYFNNEEVLFIYQR